MPPKVDAVWLWEKTVDEVLEDQCPWKPGEPPGPVVPRQPGVNGLLNYLRSVDDLQVMAMGNTFVEQRPAVRVDLAVRDPWVCRAGPRWMYLWRDTSSAGEGTPMQVFGADWLPLAILDVDGQTIVFEIWNADDWEPTGRQILDSIRFLYRPPAETPPVGPTRSP